MNGEQAGALRRVEWSPERYLERPVVGAAWRSTTTPVKRAGSAARAALTDQFLLATGRPPAPDLARRVQTAAEGAVSLGADPLLAVRTAMVCPVLASVYELAYTRGTGEAPPAQMVTGAVVQAAQLLLEGRPAHRVQDALEAAAGRRHQHVASAFADLAPIAAAAGAPNFFDLYGDDD